MTNILRVSASDEDADNNGAIKYSLTAPYDPSDINYFDIQPESGWIFLKKPLDVSSHLFTFINYLIWYQKTPIQNINIALILEKIVCTTFSRKKFISLLHKYWKWINLFCHVVIRPTLPPFRWYNFYWREKPLMLSE